MQKGNKKTFPILIFTVVFAALLITPALAKGSQEKKSNHSSAKAANHGSNHSDALKTSQHEEKPGPAWMTFGGIVKKIEGNTYTVEDYEGNQVKLYVGQGTKQIRPKKVGDTLRAEITRGGFANSIQ
jgi:uncharacterized protein YdeI (BOF family)